MENVAMPGAFGAVLLKIKEVYSHLEEHLHTSRTEFEEIINPGLLKKTKRDFSKYSTAFLPNKPFDMYDDTRVQELFNLYLTKKYNLNLF